jgi:hypothetical protein
MLDAAAAAAASEKISLPSRVYNTAISSCGTAERSPANSLRLLNV